MKLGVSAYCFSRLVRSGAMDHLQVIGKAREIGFDVIEFAGISVPEGETALSFAPRMREEADKQGIRIACYTIGADFFRDGVDNWQQEVERLKDEVRIAEALGCDFLRHDSTRGFPDGYEGPKGFDDAVPILAKGCRAVTEFAQDLGMRTMVENHGFFCQDSERVEKLMNAVGHPNFGVLVDMGNFLCADEDPPLALGRLMRYAFHVHAKDFHVKSGNEPDPGRGWFRSRARNYLRGSIIGHGNVPVSQCLSIMKAAGYEGMLSIEFEGLEDPIEGVTIGLENLRRYVGNVV